MSRCPKGGKGSLTGTWPWTMQCCTLSPELSAIWPYGICWSPAGAGFPLHVYLAYLTHTTKYVSAID